MKYFVYLCKNRFEGRRVIKQLCITFYKKAYQHNVGLKLYSISNNWEKKQDMHKILTRNAIITIMEFSYR